MEGGSQEVFCGCYEEDSQLVTYIVKNDALMMSPSFDAESVFRCFGVSVSWACENRNSLRFRVLLLRPSYQQWSAGLLRPRLRSFPVAIVW
jgi:hypothetical protein